jgi:hypothetical protein
MEKENVTWNMIELAPMKKDLDAVNLKQDHLLNPKFSSPHELIDIDSRKTRLSKVVYLRSGQILVFIQQFVGEPRHDIYLSSKHGSYLSNHKPIKTFKKVIDIFAFEEVSKFLAVYAQPTTSINIFRLDDTFYKLEWIGIQVSLNHYVGSSNLVWMEFVPGKGELVLVDDAQCVQVLELTQPAMFRPGKIQLPAPFCKACISADGACFITFSKAKANVNKNDKETEDKDASKSPSLAQDYTGMFCLGFSIMIHSLSKDLTTEFHSMHCSRTCWYNCSTSAYIVFSKTHWLVSFLLLKQSIHVGM